MTYKVTYIPLGQDVVIATVPSIELRPPIGPARIKAYLNTVGISCYNIDLNLDLWHRLQQDKEFFQSDEDRFWEGSDKWQLWQDKMMFDDFYEITLGNIVEEWTDIIAQANPRFFGLSVHFLRSQMTAKRLLESLKRKAPQIQTILGGSAAEHFGLELGWDILDWIVVGEGEHGVEMLVNNEINLVPAGVYNKETYNTDWELEAPRTPKVDITSVPYPDYSNFDFESYPKDAYSLAEDTLGVASLFIEGTRSCVFDCKFCNVRGEFGVYRARTGSAIATEMIHYYEEYGVLDFVFVDNILNGVLKNLQEMTSMLVEYQNNHNVKFAWTAYFAIRSKRQMPPDMWDTLRESGLSHIKLGIESGSTKTLKEMDKKYTKEDLLYCMEQCYRVGITTRSMYFVGYPTESHEEFEDTLDTIEKLQPYDEILKPLYIGVLMRVKPNTRAKEDYVKQGYLKKDKRFPKNYPYRMYWVYDNGTVYNDIETRVTRHKRLAEKCKELGFKYFEDPMQYELPKLEKEITKFITSDREAS
jgi:radical SAM superfamily enzyme YgiQ (UPF0313 family)